MPKTEDIYVISRQSAKEIQTQTSFREKLGQNQSPALLETINHLSSRRNDQPPAPNNIALNCSFLWSWSSIFVRLLTPNRASSS